MRICSVHKARLFGKLLQLITVVFAFLLQAPIGGAESECVSPSSFYPLHKF